MALNNNQDTNLDANPNNGANAVPPANNEGNNNISTQPQVDDTNVNNNINDEGKVFTQKNLDDAQAKARGTAERETRRKLLAMLGLKDGEEDKLVAFKEAYEASLSDDEKKNQVMEDLQAENLRLI